MKIFKNVLSIAFALMIAIPTASFAKSTSYSFEGYVGDNLIFNKTYHDDGIFKSESDGFYKKSKKIIYTGETSDDSISLELTWRTDPVDNLNPVMISSISATIFKNGKVTTIGELNNSYVTVTDLEGVAIRKEYPSKGNETFIAKFPHSDILPNAYIVITVKESLDKDVKSFKRGGFNKSSASVTNYDFMDIIQDWFLSTNPP